MPGWSIGYNRCPHHQSTWGDQSYHLMHLFIRTSANTSSFETFYDSEYFILKGGVVHYLSGRQLWLSDQIENRRCSLKAYSAGSPLRTAGRLCKAHVE